MGIRCRRACSSARSHSERSSSRTYTDTCLPIRIPVSLYGPVQVRGYPITCWHGASGQRSRTRAGRCRGRERTSRPPPPSRPCRGLCAPRCRRHRHHRHQTRQAHVAPASPPPHERRDGSFTQQVRPSRHLRIDLAGSPQHLRGDGKPTPAGWRPGYPQFPGRATYDERTSVPDQHRRWRREATAVGIIVVLIAITFGVCAVFGDNVGVGPYP